MRLKVVVLIVLVGLVVLRFGQLRLLGPPGLSRPLAPPPSAPLRLFAGLCASLVFGLAPGLRLFLRERVLHQNGLGCVFLHGLWNDQQLGDVHVFLVIEHCDDAQVVFEGDYELRDVLVGARHLRLLARENEGRHLVL